MLIDVHNHFYPPEYLDALRAGDSVVTLTVDAEGSTALDYAQGRPDLIALFHAERALRIDRLGSAVSAGLGSRGVHEPGLVAILASLFSSF